MSTDGSRVEQRELLGGWRRRRWGPTPIGSVVAYGIGAPGGRPLLLRYGRYVLISRRDAHKDHDHSAHRHEHTSNGLDVSAATAADERGEERG